jgi:hypothetical protein
VAKVRVPVERRPPTKGPIMTSNGLFKISGKFREPRPGEYYWGFFSGTVLKVHADQNWISPDRRVIMVPCEGKKGSV